jgi:plasmid stabilization system protein ParE
VAGVAIRLLPRAERELLALPDAVQEQILAKLDLLAEFPEMGVPMVDAFEGYRAVLAARRRFRVVYRVVSDTLIEVAYVRHRSRQTRVRVIRSR